MSTSRISGIILVVIGIICVGFGLSSSNAVVDQAAAAATGRFTRETMGYLIAGVAMVLGGGALFIGGRPKP